MAGNTCMRAVLAGLLAGMLSIISIPARAAQDVVLLLDNSGSMRLHDPQRLAPRAVLDFVDSRGPDTRIAIIDFATRPMVLMPLTPVSAASRAQVREVLKHLDYHGQRTDTAAALERALYELATDGRAGTQKYIILMTDGFVDVGSAVHNQEKMHWIIQSLIPEAVSDHVRIFGIAFSDEADFELLQTLAEKTGAVYPRIPGSRSDRGVPAHQRRPGKRQADAVAASERCSLSTATVWFRATAAVQHPPHQSCATDQRDSTYRLAMGRRTARAGGCGYRIISGTQ